MTPEDRLIDLETRLSYQDDAVRVLSDSLARQQKRIDQLERRLRDLGERVRSQVDSMPKNSPEEEIPPHYWGERPGHPQDRLFLQGRRR